MSYNGWKNWETWNFYTWLTNDEDYYSLLEDMTGEAAAEFLREELHDQAETLPQGFLKDAATMSIDEVDWREIAEALDEIRREVSE